jgi:hypothetical protein
VSFTIKRGASSYSVDDFLKIVKDDSIVVVADVGGGGKTTLLTEAHEKLIKTYPKYWVTFITLFNSKRYFSNDLGDSFQNFIINILKLNPLEQEVFIEKLFKKKRK